MASGTKRRAGLGRGLAAILPDPRRWSADRPGPYVRERSAFIRAQMPEVQAREPLPCGR